MVKVATHALDPGGSHTVLTSRTKLRPKAGDWVEVRSVPEILATLDKEGKVDGLPFMPEMLQFAGQRFQVTARADKTCDTISQTGGRRMLNTIHLETRCDGSAHGGCQASCLLFWKEEWLKGSGAVGVVADENLPSPGRFGLAQLEAATLQSGTATDSEVRYSCQATELLKATTPLRWWDVRQYWRDWRSGNVRLARLVRVLSMAVFNAIQRRRGGAYGFPHIPARTARVTADQKLALREGEMVRVKDVQAIVNTLDDNSKNRGLWFDAEMVPYCGGTYRVQQRVNQIIDEKTGKMLHFKNECIMLEGVVCQSEYSRGRLGCPRRIASYWREAWLERADACNDMMYKEAEQKQAEVVRVGA